MKTFVTSDLHFGHKNIMTFCPTTRSKYKGDVKFMTEEMIREWNEIVTPDDLTYILGDVAFTSGSEAGRIVNRLNGSKILIEGNHDSKTLLDVTFRSAFTEIHKYLKIKYDGLPVVMFHFPIAEWDQMHRGAVHLHGHLHGGKSGLEGYRAIDVGMDATGKIVVPMDDVLARAIRRNIKSHHGK